MVTQIYVKSITEMYGVINSHYSQIPSISAPQNLRLPPTKLFSSTIK